jgi:hypothetical protein
MVLNLPKKITFWISVALAAVGAIVFVLDYFLAIPYGAGIGFVLVSAAYALLFLGLLIKGL